MPISLEVTNTKPAPVATTLSPHPGPINTVYQQTHDIDFTVIDQYGQPFTGWSPSSSDPNIAAVSKTATGIAITGGPNAGNCTITIAP